MREKRERRDLPCNVANVIGSSHKDRMGKIPVISEMHHCMGTFEMDQVVSLVQFVFCLFVC